MKTKVDIINSIATKYPDLRQDSKPITFSLTYGGTWKTLVTNVGLKANKAKFIEQAYHDLYKQSDEWVQFKLKQATIDGYVIVAFGFKVRTPRLHNSLYPTYTDHKTEKEARTAGNALGQSYGLLNNRAAVAHIDWLLEKGILHKVLPIMPIHDAQYYCVKDDPELIKKHIEHIEKEMEWQELPEIQHDEVHLSGSSDIYEDNWTKKRK